jgi:hypothetical protein
MKKELEKAIRDSILHWERDIVAPLQKGRVIGKAPTFGRLVWVHNKKPVKMYSRHCALCQYSIKAWREKVLSEGEANAPCTYCPLYKYYPCEYSECYPRYVRGLPWACFHDCPTLGNAKRMVRILKNLLTNKEAKVKS